MYPEQRTWIYINICSWKYVNHLSQGCESVCEKKSENGVCEEQTKSEIRLKSELSHPCYLRPDTVLFSNIPSKNIYLLCQFPGVQPYPRR